MYLTFTNINDANVASLKIWYNYIMSVATNIEKIVGDGVVSYFLSDLEGMTEPQVEVLKIYGKKNGIIEEVEGFTDNWAEVQTSYSDENLHFFQKPSENLMNGVVNYIESEEQSNWFPPLT